jgi:DNA (cytosine-5)-methyltransferase 1
MGKGINTTCDEGQTAIVAFKENMSTPDATVGLGTTLQAENHHAVAFDTTQITSKANYSNPKPGDPCHPLAAGQHAPAVAYDIHGTLASKAASIVDCHTALRSRAPGQSEASTTTVVAFTQNSRDEVRQINGDCQVAGALSAEAGMHQTNYVAFKESQSGCRLGDVHATLDANKGSRRAKGVMTAMAVRRLTPRECERLQGFPDDYTLIEYRRKPAADGPRYRALGNSMAVPVMRWIGERICAVDAACIKAAGETA